MVGLVWGFITGDMVCGAPVAIGMVTDTDIEEVITMDTGEGTTQADDRDIGQAIEPEVAIVPICIEIVPPVFVLPDPHGIP